MWNHVVIILQLLVFFIAPLIKSDMHHFPQPETNDILSIENSEGESNDVDQVNIWAVLVAGSNGYYNYRHQADICHAYQILRRNGIPEKRIIVMMYDDIAYDKENPTPGVIVNRPNGTDVYKGVVKDYVGKDVTPENFMKVLLGDEEGLRGVGSGKVLKSGARDHVFINFADHGAPGLVAFPESELHARDLERTLKTMHEQHKFAQLVFYLEACESGSMFANLLPKHWNIFATTAANSQESSYACYFDNERNTYLGDVYSVMWMENADQVDLSKETLQRQFRLVKEETNTSHVQEFGDRRLRPLPVASFLGTSSSPPLQLEKYPLDPVPAGEVTRILLERKLAATTEAKERKEVKTKLMRFRQLRKLVNHEMRQIIHALTPDAKERKTLETSRLQLNNWDCYETAVRFFSRNCYSIAKNSYVTRKLQMVVNACERGWTAEALMDAMKRTCHHSFLTGIH